MCSLGNVLLPCAPACSRGCWASPSSYRTFCPGSSLFTTIQLLSSLFFSFPSEPSSSLCSSRALSCVDDWPLKILFIISAESRNPEHIPGKSLQTRLQCCHCASTLLVPQVTSLAITFEVLWIRYIQISIQVPGIPPIQSCIQLLVLAKSYTHSFMCSLDCMLTRSTGRGDCALSRL